MFVSSVKENDLTVDLVDRLLFRGLEYTDENADSIIVLGSLKAAQYRVPVAVDLYKSGKSNKLVLCGGKVREFPSGNYCEAEHMRQAALGLGVAEDDIILDNLSHNTVENILFSLSAIQRAIGLHKIHRAILVTTAYHMRRSLAIARYLFPKHITVIPCPANDTNTKQDNWMNTAVGIERAKGEAMKIVKYVLDGVIPDFEI